MAYILGIDCGFSRFRSLAYREGDTRILMIELGSSDAPSVMGCGFKTPYQLWAELVGLIEPKDEETEIMRWGTRLQHEVLSAFAEEQHLIIFREQPTVRDGPFRATPDGLLLNYQEDDDGMRLNLCEVKCVITQPPPVPRVEWIVQVLHQRMVWERASSQEDGLKAQYLVAFGGLRMTHWLIPRHQRAMDRILREEERFLELVEKQIPPPVRAEDASVLHHAWPWSRPETALLTDLQTASVAYAQGSEMAKLGESMRARAQAEIEAALQERESGIFPDGSRATWRTGKDGRRRFRMSYKEESG